MRNLTMKELNSLAVVTYSDASMGDYQLRAAHADMRRRAKQDHKRRRADKRSWLESAARGE